VALQLGALRDALDAAEGVTPELARKAAEEVAGCDDKMHSLRLELIDVRSDMRLLKWMVGACGAGILSILLGVATLLIRTRGLGT